MKHTFSLSLIGAALLAACNPVTDVNNNLPDEDASSSSVSAFFERSSSATSQTSSATTGVSSSATASVAYSSVPAEAQARTVSVSVTSWSFSPSMMTAKKGEKLTVKLTDIAGTHSFAVPGLGINQALMPGQAVDVTIPTDKPGTYEFRCMIPCGEGHKEMKGTLVITE